MEFGVLFVYILFSSTCSWFFLVNKVLFFNSDFLCGLEMNNIFYEWSLQQLVIIDYRIF